MSFNLHLGSFKFFLHRVLLKSRQIFLHHQSIHLPSKRIIKLSQLLIVSKSPTLRHHSSIVDVARCQLPSPGPNPGPNLLTKLQEPELGAQGIPR